jgi:hypothetical protein
VGFDGGKGLEDLLKDIEITGMQVGFFHVANGGNYSKHSMI